MPHVMVANDLTAHPQQADESSSSTSPENRGPGNKRSRSSPTNDSGDEGGSGPLGPPSRRGARASYYRKPQDDSRDKEKAISSSAAHMLDAVPEEDQHLKCPRVTLHERLLDAADEGDLEALKTCLRDPEVDACLNLAGWARSVTPKGHPETLAWGRGETALRIAAFHSHKTIVSALLEAGAVPGLRNDDAKHAQALCEEGSRLLAKKRRSQHVDESDLPRNQDQAERDDVWWLLGTAMEQQWIIRGSHVAGLDGRIAQIVNVGRDGRRLAIIKDQEPSARRPYYEAQAVRSVYLRPTQLCRAPPPPDGKKQWPLEARFGCALAGKTQCECDAIQGRGAFRCENVAPHEHENLVTAGRDAGGAMGAAMPMGPPPPNPLRVNRDNGEKENPKV